MIWILIIFAIALFLSLPNGEKRKTDEEVIILKMLEMFDYGESTKQDIHSLSNSIFKFCLDKSNRDVTLEELSDPIKVMENPKLFKYTAFYSAIKESISQTSKNSIILKSPLEKEKIIKETFYALTEDVINEMNKIQ